MERALSHLEELDPLLDSLVDRGLTVDERERLADLLHNDLAARRRYVRFMTLHAQLQTKHVPPPTRLPPLAEEKVESGPWPVASGRQIPDSIIPPLILDTSSPLPSPLFSLPSYIGSPVFSYLVAALLVGLGLLIASAWKLTSDVSPEIAHQALPSAGEYQREPELKAELVGRITGMVDCQWADPSTETIRGAHISLGRKYMIASGLMEITYDSGARVILQGPCTYEVESPSGGYLSLGKLTARVEKRGERRGERGDGENDKRETINDKLSVQRSAFSVQRSSNPQSLIPNPSSLSTIHYPLFTIKTPTATVTDLGTEFGVEVGKEGQTTSHVFRGSVRLQVAAVNGEMQSAACVLRENESARVENPSGGNPTIVRGPSVKPANFVRKLVRPTIKTLDLVDVVAGGDGFSGRRNRGIDPTNGRIVDAPPRVQHMYTDGKYHRVEAMPLVDGVFIPDGRTSRVQLDSAGHTFDEFPKSLEKEPNTAGYLWAGYIPSVPEGSVEMSAELGGIDYSSPGHGALLMHANKAITFDLQAIRRANPNCKLLRFRAMAGSTETMSASDSSLYNADLWVFVDGQPRFQRSKISGRDGAMWCEVRLHDNDRFLTLATTDGGNGIGWDWTMFGDPRLDLLSATSIDETQQQPRQAAATPGEAPRAGTGEPSRREENDP